MNKKPKQPAPLELGAEAQETYNELQAFKAFLLEAAGSYLSHEKFDQAERDELEMASIRIGTAVDQVTHIILRQAADHAKEHGLRQLWSALGCAFLIGGGGAASKTAAANVRATGTEAARKARSDPAAERIALVIEVDTKWPRRPNGRRKDSKQLLTHINEQLAAKGHATVETMYALNAILRRGTKVLTD